MSDNGVIERIKKLLALATSDNVHEAANAAALAQKLLLENKLQMADIADVEAEPVGMATFLEEGRNVINWRSSLILAIARNNFCDSIISWTYIDGEKRSCYKLIGKKSDTDAVTYLFSYLVNEINRLATEYAVEETEAIVRDERRLAGPGKAWFNSFRMGAVIEIQARLYNQRKEAEAVFKASASMGLAKASTALMVLDKSKVEVEAYKKKAFPKLTSQRGGRISRRDGYESGREAGRSVKLPGNEKALGAEPKRIGGSK